MKLKSILTIGLTLALAGSVCIHANVKESIKANEVTTVGKFYTRMEMTDTNGKTDVFYQFKSNDNTVWWALTEEEMGFEPKENAEYALTYNNNGTTETNKPCDCAPEYECECEVYDDEFISIKEQKEGK